MGKRKVDLTKQSAPVACNRSSYTIREANPEGLQRNSQVRKKLEQTRHDQSPHYGRTGRVS